jgi:Predicted nucleic acid-binding protein, contains PIN domain
VNVVDSSCWLEFLAGTELGRQFAPLIQKSEELIVPTVTIYEIFRKVALTSEEDALKAVALMTNGSVIDLSQELAINAALLSHEHHLPMADAMILSTARAFNATLWTLDAHFKDIEGVKWFEKKKE